ncbi:MAG: hypothetical protein KatS3mg061_0321 [Dehalococcoidia bacterium]|nr:MAG: hypothetical protein KatS3mg061_0321 [Dehalococcoidia bacterium]
MPARGGDQQFRRPAVGELAELQRAEDLPPHRFEGSEVAHPRTVQHPDDERGEGIAQASSGRDRAWLRPAARPEHEVGFASQDGPHQPVGCAGIVAAIAVEKEHDLGSVGRPGPC